MWRHPPAPGDFLFFQMFFKYVFKFCKFEKTIFYPKRCRLEKIQDFIKHLGKRTKSPFFSSFFISWILVNYRLFIGLFFYSHRDLEKVGYSSYFDLIDQTVTWNRGLFLPFLGALLYTGFAPIIKALIGLFNAWIKSMQETKETKILKDGVISTAKYLRLREQYVDSQKRLDKVIEEDSNFLKEKSGYQSEIQDLAIENRNLVDRNNSLEQEIRNLKAFKAVRDVKFLDGIWNLILLSGGDTHTRTILVYFDLNEMLFKFPTNFQSAYTIVAAARYNEKVYLEFEPIINQQAGFPLLGICYFDILDKNHLKGQNSSGHKLELRKLV